MQVEREEGVREMAEPICVIVFLTRRHNAPTRAINCRAGPHTPLCIIPASQGNRTSAAFKNMSPPDWQPLPSARARASCGSPWQSIPPVSTNSPEYWKMIFTTWRGLGQVSCPYEKHTAGLRFQGALPPETKYNNAPRPPPRQKQRRLRGLAAARPHARSMKLRKPGGWMPAKHSWLRPPR